MHIGLSYTRLTLVTTKRRRFTLFRARRNAETLAVSFNQPEHKDILSRSNGHVLLVIK